MSTDINILLLGQTGVGKTTFINSFANYLVHNSLDDGIKGELQAPISASFIHMDKDTFEEREINIGAPHESEQTRIVGESCTRECRSFLFRINNRNLRLIDTPGIGDTQGVLEDEKNFANILAVISQYEHLNGICILLKPNEDRLTILFRFCLKELLRHLHVQAKENIMFVFTNARATSFQPARAAPMLRILLESLKNDVNAVVPFSKENTFCLDNEAFRFLALCKNGINVSPEDKQDYTRSWKRTVEEFQRLLSRIAKCDKHVTRDTVSLNEAQQLIRKLSRPIGEITTLIQTNIQLAEKHKNNVSANKTLTPQVLEQIDIQIVELGYPRTVCTNEKCIKVIMDDGLEKIDYVTHCHPRCYLIGVEEDMVGDEKIKSCATINKSSGNCRLCECVWKKHMHITYELRKFMSKINIDINSSSDSKPANEVIEQRIKTLTDEKNAILAVCSKIAHFLRINSLNPVNDDIMEYIQHFIREERMKNSAGAKNDDIINGLEKLAADYRHEMDLLQSLVKKSETNATNLTSIIQPAQIFDLVRTLYQLPIYGVKIRQQVEQVKNVQQRTRENREHIIKLPATAETTPTMIGLRKVLG